MDGAEIRPATSADADAVGRVLAEAFDDYAWTRWALGDRNRRERLESLYRLEAGLAGAERRGTWLAEVGGRVAAVACWSRPDAPELSRRTRKRLASEVPPLLGKRVAALGAAEAAVATARPAGPSWLLGAVGTTPRWRGKGLATALIQAGLRAVDTEGSAAVLETSSAGNVRLYERLGFSVTAEVDPPGGAPHVWVMQRPARDAVRP